MKDASPEMKWPSPGMSWLMRSCSSLNFRRGSWCMVWQEPDSLQGSPGRSVACN